MKFACVIHDFVDNIVLADQQWADAQPDRYELADGIEVGIGWNWPPGETPTPPLIVTQPITRATAEVRDDLPRAVRIRIRDALSDRNGWALTDAQKSELEEFIEWLRVCATVEKDDANLAAGIVIRELGTAVVDPDELRRAFDRGDGHGGAR